MRSCASFFSVVSTYLLQHIHLALLQTDYAQQVACLNLPLVHIVSFTIISSALLHAPFHRAAPCSSRLCASPLACVITPVFTALTCCDFPLALSATAAAPRVHVRTFPRAFAAPHYLSCACRTSYAALLPIALLFHYRIEVRQQPDGVHALFLNFVFNKLLSLLDSFVHVFAFIVQQIESVQLLLHIAQFATKPLI